MSAWVEGSGPLPEAARAVAGMDAQLRTQDEVAQRLQSHIGQYDALVTGHSETDTCVRIVMPPAEDRVDAGSQTLDVGDKVRVKLVSTDVERGFIDFVLVD